MTGKLRIKQDGASPHPVCLWWESVGMLKTVACLGVVFFLFSCASFDLFNLYGGGGQAAPVSPDKVQNFTIPSIKDQSKSGYWITRSPDNALVIIGVSNRMRRQDSEIAAAKEDAAQKVSMFYGVGGTIESYYSVGANALEYIADSQMDLVYDTDVEKYIDQLKFDPERDVVIIDEAVFVRFTYAATPAPVNFVASLNADGRPDWTYSRDLPQFDGYITAVGMARNQIRLKETIRKSSDAAIAWMIAHISTQITSNDKTGSGMGSSNQTHSVSTGRVNEFQIIEFWIDPKSGYVYTLAIAKQSR